MHGADGGVRRRHVPGHRVEHLGSPVLPRLVLEVVDGVDGKQRLGGGNGTAAGLAANHYGAHDDAWFLVQTNYDHWRPDPASDPRRSAAERMLREMGEAGVGGAAVLSLFAVASSYPVANPHTAYTAIMDPATGALTAYVREAMCPVDAQLAQEDPRYCTSAWW